MSRTAFPGKYHSEEPVGSRVCENPLAVSVHQPADHHRQRARPRFLLHLAGRPVTDQGDARVDYRLSDKDSLFGSLSWSNTGKTSGRPFPGPLDGADFNGAQETDLSRNAQISYTRVWNPYADFGNARWLHPAGYVAPRREPDDRPVRGVRHRRLQPDRQPPTMAALPQITFGNNYQQTGANDWIPTKEFNNVWDFVQNVAINKGSHSLKFGARIPTGQVPVLPGSRSARQHRLQQEPDGVPDGGEGTNGTNIDSQTGDSIASALIGQLDSGNISTTNFVSSQKSPMRVMRRMTGKSLRN